MLLVIIAALVVGTLSAISESQYYNSRPSEAFFWGGLVAAGVAFFVAWMIGTSITPSHYEARPKIALQNIADNTHTEGAFFLGSGVIDGSPYYSWYEQTAANDFVRKDAPADESTIHYVTDGARPYYVRSVAVYDKRPFVHAWYLGHESGETGDEKYDFYVPRGTITSEFKLDAQG